MDLLHLIRRGKVVVHHAAGQPITIAQPSPLLHPRPSANHFAIDGNDCAGSDVAEVEF